MHDPMVVAHEVPSPFLHRRSWRDNDAHGRRWGLLRARRTNAENLGEPVYRWWRPKGWTLYLAGRAYGLGTLATIWHVEPGGRDSGEVCKHYRRNPDGTITYTKGWKWHVHHWHIQIPPLQAWRRRLFDRCAECGRKGSPNISHQWDGPGVGWRKWQSTPGLYHRECSSLISARRSNEQKDDLIRLLAAQLRLETDETEPELIERLQARGKPGGTPGFTENFNLVRQLERILGYERGDNYELVKAD